MCNAAKTVARDPLKRKSIHPCRRGWVQDPLPQNPNATQEEIMCALAKCVPAISSPVGGTVFLSDDEEDCDLNDDKYRQGWGRKNDSQWKHSDMKDMAYFYVYPLYDELVTKGSVK